MTKRGDTKGEWVMADISTRFLAKAFNWSKDSYRSAKEIGGGVPETPREYARFFGISEDDWKQKLQQLHRLGLISYCGESGLDAWLTPAGWELINQYSYPWYL